MRSFIFTDQQISSLTHALGVAAEQFDKDAEEFRRLGQAGREAYSRTIEQFEKQAAECRELADFIEWKGAKPEAQA